MKQKLSPLVIVFFTVFIDLLGFGLVVPILPIYTKELGASDFVVGFVAAIYSLMNFFFTPFLGSYSDRVGRRPIILGAIFINAISYFIFSKANTLFILLLSRTLAGIGSSNIAAAQAYITDITPPERRAKSMGLIGAAFGLGFVFGPAMGGMLKTSYGIEWVGYVAAGLCSLNFVMAYFSLPESLKVRNESAQLRFVPIKDYIKAFKTPILKDLFMFSFVYITAFMLMQITLSLLWKEHYSLNEREIGYGFAVIGVTTAVVQGGLVGHLVKKYGEKKLFYWGNFLMAVGLLMPPFIPLAWFKLGSLVAILLICFANGMLTPTLNALISKTAPPNEQGRILGLSQSFGSLARVIGPISAGLLYHFDFRLPYIVACFMMLFCAYLASVAIQQISEEIPEEIHQPKILDASL
jgi:multidrug resistance protein